jgi:hypothetical protein
MKVTEQDKVIFTIGACDQTPANTFVGYDLDSTWNGFDNVAVTKEVHEKLLEWVNDQHDMALDPDGKPDPDDWQPDDQGLYHWVNGWTIEIDEDISPNTYAIVMVKVDNPNPTESVCRRPENAHYEEMKNKLGRRLNKVLGAESINTWWIDDIHNSHLSGS